MLKYTVTIGKTDTDQGTTVNVDALEITLNKSEELDFGVFTIPAITRFENFQILDRVDIEVTDGIYTETYDPFVIIGDKVTPVSKFGFFKHTITIIENVHKFEKVLSSSLYITQPLVGEKKSLLSVLEHIRAVIPFERTSFLSSTRLYNIDQNLSEYLSEIDAPQFFFNGGSLRDILNGVSSYVNAIARLEDSNNLIFSFYDEILNRIGILDNVIHKTLSNQTDKWSSTIESTLENAVASDDTNKAVVIHPSPQSWVSARSRQVKMTDDSFEIRVPYPIERITNVVFRTFLELGYIEVTSLNDLPEYSSNPITSVLYYRTTDERYFRYRLAQTPFEEDGFVELIEYVNFELISVAPFQNINNPGFAKLLLYVDVTDQILILDQWKRLDLDRTTKIQRNNRNLKINCFNFEIGGKVITNTLLGGIFNDITAFRAFHLRALVKAGMDIAQLAAVDNLQIDFNKEPHNTIAVDVTDTVIRDFRISFVPYFGTRIRSEKNSILDHPYNTQVAINQAERIVSADRLLNNIYGLAQRTGQDEIVVKRYHTDLSESFELGDITSDGFVIASIHYTYYIKYFLVNYQLTRNFNRFSNRIALNQENRPFDVGLGSKTTNRKLIYTEYVELDTKSAVNTSLVRREGINVFGNTLRADKEANNKPVHFGTLYASEMQDVDEGDGIFLKTIPFSDGNTLNFHWGFDDILGVDDQLVTDAFFGDNSVLEVDVKVNNLIRYTNSLGELDTFELAFYNELDEEIYESKDYPIIKLPTTPLIGGHSIIEDTFDSFTVQKDKSESITMNYQLALVPHFDYSDKIFVGRELVRRNNLITQFPTDTETYFVYASTEETYNGLDLVKVKGAIRTNASYSIDLLGNIDGNSHLKLTAHFPNTVGIRSWGIGDADGNLYLGVNITTEQITEVFFNFINRRSGQEYTFDGRVIQTSISPSITLESGLDSIIVNITDNQTSDFFEVIIKDLLTGETTTQTITNTQTSFTNLPQVTEYEVSVKAIKNGITSPSTTRRIFTKGTPAKVENVFTTVEGNDIRVHWNSVDGATVYQIQYRKTNEDISLAQSEFVGKDVTSELIKDLDFNVPYLFRVRGINLQFSGDFSDEVLGVIIDSTNLDITLIPSFDSISIDWEEVPNSSGYQLGFKEAVQSSFNTFNFFDPELTNFVLSGLNQTTFYDIRFRVVFTFDGENLFTDYVTKRVSTTFQPPPGDLAAPVLTNSPNFPTTTQASWIVTNNNNTEVNVFYDFYDTENFTTTTARGTLAANSSTTAVVNAAQGETRFIVAQFKQQFFNDSPVAFASQTIQIATPMTAPATVSISDITTSSAKATWTFVEDATNGYIIQIRTSPGNVLVEQRERGRMVVVTTFDNLTQNTQYFVRVRTKAFNERPQSDFTNSNPFTTEPLPGIPATPTNLQVVSFADDGDQTVVNLAWTDNATDEIGYRVYSRFGTVGAFQNVSGTLPANTTTFQDTVPSGGPISYYVAAFNGNGEAASEILVFEATATIPATPTNLQVTSSFVDGDEVTVNLSWTDNATNELGYRVYSRLGSSGSFTNVSGNLPPNTTTYQDKAPVGGAIFYYVEAFNLVGESVSNTIQF